MAQATHDYDALVQQGNAQLQAGSNDAALASANAAIKLDANRWEAYAVAGGALINLKRCDEATDDLNRGVKLAPAPKQAGLQGLLRQCESDRPTLKETSDYLAKTLEEYGGSDHRGSARSWITDVGIDSQCVLRWKEENRDIAVKKYFLDREYTIPLGAVHSFHSDPENPFLIIVETGDIEAIRYTQNESGNHQYSGAETQAAISIDRTPPAQPDSQAPLYPLQMVPHVGAALEHARTLCQGTYSKPVQTHSLF